LALLDLKKVIDEAAQTTHAAELEAGFLPFDLASDGKMAGTSTISKVLQARLPRTL
jgi:hypothetical protein